METNEIVNNSAIVHFLGEQQFTGGFVDKLKIKYRSLICPFISLIQKVKPGEKVADVGCGNGQFLLLLSKFARPSYLYGIEVTEKLINNARKLFQKAGQQRYQFDLYDGEHFPSELGEMDIIFLIDVLHHVPKPRQELFLKSLAMVIKPGARLVLKDINRASPFVLFNKIHDLVFSGEIGNELSAEKVLSILKANGLEIVEQEKRLMYVYPHYTYVARKK